jgi:hypothetical protein
VPAGRPEGIATLQAAHPDVDIYTAAIDRQLDDHGYILPGLGDAGDHHFPQVARNQPELRQRSLQVFHNLARNHARCGQVVAVGQ